MSKILWSKTLTPPPELTVGKDGLNRKQRELLGGGDPHLLFQQGGCHIFAMALADSLCRHKGLGVLQQQLRFGPPRGLHAFVFVGSDMVDVDGVKSLDGYFAAKRAEFDCGEVTLVQATRGQLLEVNREEFGIAKNRWGHSVNPVFLQKAGEIARVHIRARPCIYGRLIFEQMKGSLG